MYTTVYVNVKINSVSEANQKVKFEANSDGLFKVSVLCNIFDRAKAAIARAEPENQKYGIDYIDNIAKSYELSSSLLLGSFNQNQSFKEINDEYWACLDLFKLILKGCSNLYADGVNAIEHHNVSQYNEIAIALTKQYSVFAPSGNNRESYASYCIFTLSQIIHDLEKVYDFTVSHLFFFDSQLSNLHLNNEMKGVFIDRCWFIAFEAISSCVERHITIDPNFRDRDGFWLRYKNSIALIKQEVETLALNIKSQSMVASNPASSIQKSRSFLSRLFGRN